MSAGEEVADRSYYYIVVMYGIFATCFVVGAIFRDNRERTKKHVYLTADDRLLRGSLRAMLLLGAFIIVCSFPLTSSEFYTANNFSLSRFLLLDLQSLKNVLHGGFVVGVYSNFCSTGNPRYFTLTYTFLIFLLFPCSLATFLSGLQLFLFGPRVLANFGVSVTMLLLTLLGWLYLRKAYAATVHAKFRSRTLSLLEGEKKVLAAVSTSGRLDLFLSLRKRARLWMLLEGGCFVLINLLILIYRITPAEDGAVSFDQFLPNFISAYTMSIHLGWTVGNGLHGVGTNSVKSIELYGYSKIVIGSLNFVQTLSLCYRAAYPASILNRPDITSYQTVMPSVLFSFLYTFAQGVALLFCSRLRRVLLAIRYDADKYNPDGEVVADENGFSIMELARSNKSDISVFAKGRAFRAAIVTMACGLLLQAEGILLIATDVSPEALMTAMDGGLHAVAVFMLQYYRGVQNFTVRLLRRRTLQMWSFLCYAFVGGVQMIGLFTAVGMMHGRWSDTTNFAFIVLLLRISFNCVGAWSFYSLRLLAPETTCCWVVTRENIPASSLRARQEQEMQSLALPTALPALLADNPTPSTGHSDGTSSGSANSLPVAMVAPAHLVLAQLRGSEPVRMALPVPTALAVPSGTGGSVAASASNSSPAVSAPAPDAVPIHSDEKTSVSASPPVAIAVPSTSPPPPTSLASSIQIGLAIPAPAPTAVAVVPTAVPVGPKRYTFDRLPENLADSDFADDTANDKSQSAAVGAGGGVAAASVQESDDTLIDPNKATPFDADPMRSEDEFFASSEGATIGWAIGMATLGIVIAFLHTALSDPTGLLWAPSHGSAATIGSSGSGMGSDSLSAAHISTWHTPAYSIVFHFCFLVFGYGYRGVTARNVTLLQFTFLTTLSVGTVLATCGLSSILMVVSHGNRAVTTTAGSTGTTPLSVFRSLVAWLPLPGDHTPGETYYLAFWLYVGCCALLGVVSWYTSYRQRITSLYVQKFPLRYPQSGHSMM